MHHRLIAFAFLVLLTLLAVFPAIPEFLPHSEAAFSAPRSIPPAAQDAIATSIPILISDFELLATGAIPPAKPNAPRPPKKSPASASGTATKDAPPAVLSDTDIPGVQARELVDFFSTTLAESLRKGGYKAVHQVSTGAGSAAGGVLLRGVFAEPDALNRIRRAVLGAGSPGAKFLLYVGTFNLSRPDQPLYQLASVQAADARYGPVITPNAYIPLVKYEIPKNPTEDDVRKVCEDIVRNLTALLNANPASFAH
jgi:hypothetical protein